MLSPLSNKPPCPGKIIPESLRFAFLLRYEINKSPVIEKTTIKTNYNKNDRLMK